MAAAAATPERAFARRLFDGIAWGYDPLAELLSYGQYGRWRRALVDAVPVGEGARVLDVATGTAGVAIAMARRYGCEVVGIDQSAGMLEGARRGVERAGVEAKVKLVEGDAGALPFPDASFDAVTFTFLLRYVADPAVVIRELARVLKPGGVMGAIEFGVPGELLPWLGWVAHTRLLLSVTGRLLTPGWAEVGRFLGPSISRFYRRHPLSEQRTWWRGAGLERVRVRRLSLGGGLVWSARRAHG
jgi:demethylmenaquinone methyltransferase/2-methoxy-6-polyprenyl-1,4-benzoquinol methylase